jgi:hypothetical protein
MCNIDVLGNTGLEYLPLSHTVTYSSFITPSGQGYDLDVPGFSSQIFSPNGPDQRWYPIN